MSDELIAQQCSPTLAGIKTGNLFRCAFSSKEELKQDLRKLNRMLGPKGVRVLPLSVKEQSALIYLYRPAQLQRDIQNESALKILEDKGYPKGSPDRFILHLMQELKSGNEFPHEIGLFLGYPPEDVQGFIDNQAHNQKCTGCWKVYGDVESATRTFHRYHECTKAYVDMVRKGKSIEQLTIAG